MIFFFDLLVRDRRLLTSTGNPLDSYLFHCCKNLVGSIMEISRHKKNKVWRVSGLKCVRLESFELALYQTVLEGNL